MAKSDDEVKVKVSLDTSEAEAQIEHLRQLGDREANNRPIGANAGMPGRRSRKVGVWGTFSSAENEVERIKIAPSATPKSKPGVVGSILRTVGLIPPGSSGSLAAIAQPGLADAALLKSGLFTDPSVGGFNQSGLAGASSSAKARGLLYRARAVALGNPLALFRSVLAVWALKRATDYGKSLLSEASENFSKEDPGKNFDAIGLAARNQLADTGTAIADGFKKTWGELSNIYYLGGGAILGAAAYAGTTWGNTRDRERALGAVGADVDDFIQQVEFQTDRKNSRIQKQIDYREGISARNNQVIDRAAELLERSRTTFMESGFMNEIQRKGGGSVESLDKFFDPVARANLKKALAETGNTQGRDLGEIQFRQRPDNGFRPKNYPYYR